MPRASHDWRGDVADQRALRGVDTVAASGGVDLDAVRIRRERARDRLVQRVAGDLLELLLLLRAELRSRAPIDEVLGDRVERAQAVARQVADRVLEVAIVAERVALRGVDRRLERGRDRPRPGTCCRPCRRPSGPGRGSCSGRSGSWPRCRSAAPDWWPSRRRPSGRRRAMRRRCRSRRRPRLLRRLAEAREEDARLLAQPGRDVLLVVDRVPIRLRLALDQRDDLGPRIRGLHDLAERRLGVGPRGAGRLDGRIQIERGARRHGGRRADVDAAAPATTAACQDRRR